MRAIRSWGEASFRDFFVAKGIQLGETGEIVSRPPIAIGGHPDYEYLVGTDNIVVGHVSTLFVDLNRYTSRTLVMKDDPDELSEIVNTKRQLIAGLVRFVQLGDGHVHSITGDGVMAFFGRSHESKLDGCKKALQTALAILHYVKNHLNPMLEERDMSTVHIRAGLDFSEVRWLAMGVDNYSEVKAVGYGVDIAAKLLSPSKAWKARVGQTLFEELPDELQEYLRPVDREKDGEDESPELQRQYKGKTVVYKKYIFEWERVVSDSGGDSDTALSLIESAGKQSIYIPNIEAAGRRSIDDDDVTFG